MSSNVADSFDFDADNFAEEGKDSIGKSSSELPQPASSRGSETEETKSGLLSSFSLWDGLLLTSLICVTFATLHVYYSLYQEFKTLFFMWRVN